MANLTITINTDNDAFKESEGGEVARILHEIADEFAPDYLLNPDGESGTLKDTNGNKVGEYIVS
jgi:hypothetical protein